MNCEVVFYVICVFWPKNAQIKKKRPSTFVLFNFKQLLFYEYPPKNASKYPKIAILKITIFDEIFEKKFI